MSLGGIISLDGSAIVDFILSCRVFGRKIEDAMIATALAHARQQGIETVTALDRAGNEGPPSGTAQGRGP